jgi:hypothetical protein
MTEEVIDSYSSKRISESEKSLFQKSIFKGHQLNSDLLD